MNILAALLAGLLTFLSPCVFPLIPSYISYITGLSIEELSTGDKKATMKKTIVGSLSFILGFTLVFVLLGLTASYAGSLIFQFQNYLRIIGGAIIIFFGLFLAGVFNFKFMNFEARVHFKGKPIGILGSFLFGMTFAAGWVPCVGPVLSTILILASTTGSRFYGGFLLFVYCIGLGAPLFLSAVLFNYFLVAYKRIAKYLNVITVISGIVLIIIGVLLISDNLVVLSRYAPDIIKIKE
jgi:cytochrome c-type biogenesis protein